MEAAVWAVSRWADTYLLSEEEDLSVAMAQSFGAAGDGPSVLAALVQLAGMLLTDKFATKFHFCLGSQSCSPFGEMHLHATSKLQ